MNTLIPERLSAFLAEGDEGTIVMLNLLRFRSDGGRARYDEYLSKAAPILARYGAEIAFAGEGLPALAAEEGQAWDAIAFVRYPSRGAFAALVGDAEYAMVDPVRRSALEEAVLQPIVPMAHYGQPSL